MRARSVESRYRPPRDDGLPLDLRRKALGRGVAVVITAARRGRISPDAVAERMEDAADVLRRMPATDRPSGCRCSMPTPLREVRDVWTRALEEGRWEDMVASPSVPSAEDISRMDEALGWLRLLPGDDAKLVWMRATRTPWKVLVWRFRAGKTTLWRRWTAALVDISLKLNDKNGTK
jgi:hypothetical protein